MKFNSRTHSRPGKGSKILSFFTGGGGLDLGFETAGFETVYATDHDAGCCETLGMNKGAFFNSKMLIEQADICLIEPKSLPSAGIDLIIGGPPCQSFSASGRRAGGAAGRLDKRGTLFQAYCRIIKHVEPKAFVFENVRGILSTNGGADWLAIVRAFQRLGYKLTYRLLDALDYGAPQQRERMFLVGHKLKEDFLFPEPTFGPDSASARKHVSAQDAIAGISETENLSSLRLMNGKYSHLLPLVPPGQNYLFFTAKRGYPRPVFAYRSRFSDFLYKAAPELPIKTLIASPGKYTGPLHWDNRYFSIKEYMRLQGFPDDYKFAGARDQIIQQIGNSVSPLIAHQLALAIAKQIFGRRSDVRLLTKERTLSFDNRKGTKAKRTRIMHTEVTNNHSDSSELFFDLKSYRSLVNPTRPNQTENVLVSVDGNRVAINVAGNSSRMFARMELSVSQQFKRDAVTKGNRPIILRVEGRGSEPATIQLMWDAVDDWVRRSSNFHSLFELYGHFTEPHPIFSITSFEAFSHHPILVFAKHAARFENCSRYFPKSHLVKLFGKTLGTRDFMKIATYLREFRFDIRSRETNVAIEETKYMVAYPFTLPARRQMNFKPRTFVPSKLTMVRHR